MSEPEPKRKRRWWRPVLLTAGAVVAAVELHDKMPAPASTLAQLRQAEPMWLAAAAVLQTVSMWAFAEQHRRLLAAFGVRMRAGVSVALTYIRSAIATALPGGSAISAGYAFRRFRSHGATAPAAAAVMVLSGVASTAGLALLYAGDLMAYTSLAYPVAAVIGVGIVTALVIPRRIPQRPSEPSPQGSLGGRVRHTMRLAASVSPRDWAYVLFLAAVNWLADLACLLAALQAVGLAVPVRTVATAYLATQLVRQIPLTPGGIGLVEASLVFAFVAAGAAQAPAAAAVIIYRLLSSWSLVPIGFVLAAASHRGLGNADRPLLGTKPILDSAATDSLESPPTISMYTSSV